MQLQFYSSEEIIESLYDISDEVSLDNVLQQMSGIENGDYGFMQKGTKSVVFVGMFGWVDAIAWYKLCPNARVTYVANPSYIRN